MYVDYSNDGSKRQNRRRRNNKGNPRNILLIILIVIVVIILGLAIFSEVKEGKISSFFSKVNEEPGEVADENLEKDPEGILEDQTSDDKDESSEDAKSPDGDDENIEEESVSPEDQGTISTRGEPVKAKGIYVTGPVAGLTDRRNELVDLVNNTELNAMVIDIKNDDGVITYKMDHDLVQEMGATINYISNIEELIQELKEQDIYLIARIVAFKDPMLAEHRPDLSLKNTDGSLFRDKDGLGWVNPYNKDVWDYLVEISLEAIELGFDEIQFDYIRFSTDKRMKDVDFGPEAATKSKTQVITEFTQYAYERLSPYAYVSADVYGAIIDSKVDQDIVGQDYVEMAKHLDYICPMVYPSHYHNGAYGLAYPDLEPYNLILASLQASEEVLSVIPEGTHVAQVRPWLQDFTAPWISNYQTYGPQQIRDQVLGVYDAGYEEWILWNGSNKYTGGGLLAE